MNDSIQASSGLLLVDKAAGMTSHDVVARVRRELLRAHPHWDPRLGTGRRKGGGKGPRPPRFKCGHAGTLDPLATGLLLVLVGKGSRLSNFLMGMDKTYQATLKLGTATDSLDADGEVTATAPLPAGPEVLEACLPEFTGDILQVPPAVSALKHEGTPLYKLVRQGRELPELKARPVTIHQLFIKAVRWDVGEVDLRVGCSSGTYIRSLARDLAQAAGSEGHLTALRRSRIGPFAVEDALDRIMERDGQAMAAALRPLAEALPHRPSLVLDAEQAAFVRQGGQPVPSWLDGPWESPFQDEDTEAIFRMVDSDGCLVAVGCRESDPPAVRCAAVIPAQSGNPQEQDT